MEHLSLSLALFENYIVEGPLELTWGCEYSSRILELLLPPLLLLLNYPLVTIMILLGSWMEGFY